eukprot:13259257-Ditylum_brightwellii.AAC.1
MEYTMLTTYAPSKITNNHSSTSPLHGIGQGPTGTPPGWTFDVSIIKKCYSKKVYEHIIKDPLGKISVDRSVSIFVDDSKLAHNRGKRDYTPKTLMSMIRHDITPWDTYLNIDRGILELLKTAYAMLVWIFDKDGTPEIIPVSDFLNNKVQVHRHGIPITTKQVAANKSLKLLGFPTTLDLNNQALITHITKQTRQYARAIIACPFS